MTTTGLNQRNLQMNLKPHILGFKWGKIVFKIYFHCITILKLLASLYPTSLANLVVEVGTRHSQQILFRDILLKLLSSIKSGTQRYTNVCSRHASSHLQFPLGVSAPGGNIRKKLLKDHNFLNNSPIVISESFTFNIFAFQKALHTIHFNMKNCFGFGERYLTPKFYGRMRVPAVSKHMQPFKWD